MSKAEEFIKKNTSQLSNEDGFDYIPWLTPDQARKAVEIARGEILNGVCEWIKENIGEFGQERFINDLKQAMKCE